MSIPQNDLFSAWFDDEAEALSEEERQQVTAHVAGAEFKDPEFKRGADELREMNALLNDLPPQCAPAGFADAILRQATEPAVTNSGGAETSPGQRSYWNVAAAIACCCLVFAVCYSMLPEPGFRVASSTIEGEDNELSNNALPGSGNESMGSMPSSVAADESAMPFEQPAAPSTVGDQEEVMSMSAASTSVSAGGESVRAAGGFGGGGGGGFSAGGGQSMAREKSADAPAFSATAVRKTNPSAEAMRGSAQGLQLGSLQFDNRILQDSDVGQVISAIDTSGDEVAIVKLTVVDRQLGSEKLEVILARNNFIASNDAAAHDAAPAKRGRTGAMMSVLVEATPEQLADCVMALREEELFKALELAKTSSAKDSTVGRDLQTQVAAADVPRYSHEEKQKLVAQPKKQLRMRQQTKGERENASVATKNAPVTLRRVLFVLEPAKPADPDDINDSSALPRKKAARIRA